MGVAALAVCPSWTFSAPNADQRGFWQTEGYGIVLDMGRLHSKIYKITENTCHSYFSFPSHLGLVKTLEWLEFLPDGDRLRFDAQGTLNPVYADLIPELPSRYDPLTPGTTATADQVFDVMWEAMDEHYNFFGGCPR